MNIRIVFNCGEGKGGRGELYRLNFVEFEMERV
jgi:hypothetical protein